MLPLKRVITTAVDLLLPPRCPGTGEVVDAPGMVSPAFWQELRFIEAPFCPVCGLPFDFEMGEGALCAACIERAPDFDAARAAVVYNDASRKLILNFKYGDRLHAVKTFVPWLLRAGAELIAESDVIVPVPLHPWRLWVRRFNQSALLAQELARGAEKTCLPDGLLRLRPTPQQKGLSRKKRAANVRGAFGMNEKHDVKGRNVLLIDDVLTSGATLNECAKVLKRAGALRVCVLTVARVTREGAAG